MQTFLPYSDFAHSALCLDMRRLGKQRVECFQILQTLIGKSNGWKNHPAVKMWRGHEMSLCTYGMVICSEWSSRGYKDNMFNRIADIYTDLFYSNACCENPSWLGVEKFHSSHRAALLFKNYEWYKQFNWAEEPKLEYYWPV